MKLAASRRLVFSLVALAASCGIALAIEPTPALLAFLSHQRDLQIKDCRRRVLDAEMRLSAAEATVISKEPIKMRTAKNKDLQKKFEKEYKHQQAAQEAAERRRKTELEDANRELIHAKELLGLREADEMPAWESSFLGGRLFVVDSPGAFRPLKIGDFGSFGNYATSLDHSRILQILNDNEMLVNVERGPLNEYRPNRPQSLVLVRAETKGLADDTPITFEENRKFLVAGTYKYETAAGSTKTVMVLEEIDMQAVREFLKQRIAKADAAKNSAEPK